MQIGDVYSQFQNTVTGQNGQGQAVTGADLKGVQRADNPLSELKPGQVFSGNVVSASGDKVTLSLDGGQQIFARLTEGIKLSQGESFLFEVKENSGGQIQISPMPLETGNNMALLDALFSANLPRSKQNVEMVRDMMQEQMNVNSKALNDMARLIKQFPETEPSTVVMMKKYDIPVTKEMIAQFENYKANEGAIMNAVDEMVDSMSSSFAKEGITAKDIADFQNTLVKTLQLSGEGEEAAGEGVKGAAGEADVSGKVVTEGSSAEGEAKVASENLKATNEAEIAEPGKQSAEVTGDKASADSQAVNNGSNKTETGDKTNNVSDAISKALSEIQAKGESADNAKVTVDPSKITDPTKPADISNSADTTKTVDTAQSERASADEQNASGTLKTILGKENLKELNNLIKDYPSLKEKAPELFNENGNLKPEAKVTDVLNKLTEAFKDNPNMGKEKLLDMISSDPYKKMMHNLMEDSWTISPKELTKENKVQNLYEKLETHMKQLEETAKQLTNDPNNAFSKVAEGVRDNIDFMNHVNQNFTYVQIPLKFSNQSATGDLYVIKNKKTPHDPDEMLTAFLHFDLDHLGSTDISVKLLRNNVDTQFYMSDDKSFKLLQDNIGELEERLKNKGYNVTLSVSNDEKGLNLIDDVMKKAEKPAAASTPKQRFSFDARA